MDCNNTRSTSAGFVKWRLALLAAAAAFLCVGWLWHICVHDSTIPFLSDHPPAKWIVYPKPPDPNPHRAAALAATFQRSFTLSAAPATARLSVRTFKQGTLFINGQPVPDFGLEERDWKKAHATEVTRLLHAGTNEIVAVVSNRFGPPALWLSLQTDQLGLHSDTEWQVSLAGAQQQPAVAASDIPAIRPGNPLFGRELVKESLSRTWSTQLIIVALAVGVVAGWNWILRTYGKGNASSWFAKLSRKLVAADATAVLLLLLALWAVLFCNNLPQLAPLLGFDRDGHTEYINYLLEHKSLPLADAGWQMYQPPLYYLLSAAILGPLDLSASSDAGLLILRGFSALTGMLHLVLLFLCLRLLFPGKPSRQVVGLLIGGLLPANIYLSHHVTNEGLAALFVTATLYFTLRILRPGAASSPRPSPPGEERERCSSSSVKLHLAVGACLGLAMLTKFSAVLAIPLVFVALAWKALTCKRTCAGTMNLRQDAAVTGKQGCLPPQASKDAGTPGDSWVALLCPLGFTLAAMLLLCGWHYVRVWQHFGNPLIGNWDPKLSFAWWQDPGYRMAGWYGHFGSSLVTPLFSSLSGFADGIYSSLWGDGLGSGSARILFRPQWNYDLMNAGYLLALIMTMLVTAGAIATLVRFLQRPTAEWFLLSGLVAAFGFGLVFMTLRVASYAQVKAFYALPAVLPLCALGGAGWGLIEHRQAGWRSLAWIGLVAWCLTTYATFWIRPANPFTSTARGISLADDGRYEEAIKSFSRALELDGQARGARVELAAALDRLNRYDEARQQLDRSLGQGPRDAEALIESAINSAAATRYEEAAQSLRAAIAQAPDHPTVYRQLATCLRWLGRRQELIETCRQGLRVDALDPKLHELLAGALVEAGDLTNAAAHLRLALELKPTLVEARKLLAFTFASLGKLEEAATQYQEALQQKPEDPPLRYQFGLLLSTQGNLSGAAEQYRQALAQQPDMVEALNNLAWLLAAGSSESIRNGPEAVQLAERACELTQRREPVLLGTLAAAYAEAGRFPEAVSTAEKARDLAAAAGQKEVADKNRQLLELYQAGKPYHEGEAASTQRR